MHTFNGFVHTACVSVCMTKTCISMSPLPDSGLKQRTKNETKREKECARAAVPTSTDDENYAICAMNQNIYI